ncbi:MAG: hypothetical protein WCT37_02425 [Patescibacteria group bacterium]|jgi:hypothetical protein
MEKSEWKFGMCLNCRRIKVVAKERPRTVADDPTIILAVETFWPYQEEIYMTFSPDGSFFVEIEDDANKAMTKLEKQHLLLQRLPERLAPKLRKKYGAAILAGQKKIAALFAAENLGELVKLMTKSRPYLAIAITPALQILGESCNAGGRGLLRTVPTAIIAKMFKPGESLPLE